MSMGLYTSTTVKGQMGGREWTSTSSTYAVKSYLTRFIPWRLEPVGCNERGIDHMYVHAFVDDQAV